MITIDLLQTELQNCPGREEDLRAVTRYSNYSPMFYRTNLWTHAKRVTYMVDAVIPHAMKVFPNFDPEYALCVALVHDDAEMIIGDEQSTHKNKMSADERHALDSKEENAIDLLAEKFPRSISVWNYSDTLRDVLFVQSLEVQVMKYFDKFEGLGEALHEVYGGNITFTTHVTNAWGTLPNPFEFYKECFTEFPKKYPQTAPLFQTDFPLFGQYPELPWEEIAARSKPHTEASLKESTGCEYYDFWRANIIAHGDAEEIRNLYTQKEFHQIS